MELCRYEKYLTETIFCSMRIMLTTLFRHQIFCLETINWTEHWQSDEHFKFMTLMKEAKSCYRYGPGRKIFCPEKKNMKRVS